MNQMDNSSLSIYGSDRIHIEALIAHNPQLKRKLHERLPYIQAEVIWAARNEMALTVEDVLARRLRALFLDARAAIDMAPQVACLMAHELNFDELWERNQIRNFTALANKYLLEPYSPVEANNQEQLLT